VSELASSVMLYREGVMGVDFSHGDVHEPTCCPRLTPCMLGPFPPELSGNRFPEPLDLEWFLKYVIEAGSEGATSEIRSRMTGHRDDRQMPPDLLPCPDPGDGAKPVHDRHFDIHEHEGVIPRLNRGHRVPAVVHGRRSMAQVLNEGDDQGPAEGTIIDDQYLARLLLLDPQRTHIHVHNSRIPLAGPGVIPSLVGSERSNTMESGGLR
jgi:hypothetical protein